MRRAALALLPAFACARALCAASAAEVQGRIAADVARGQPIVAHVIVALCDNRYQGIVPVPESVGDGQNPRSNLYWGAAFGVRTYFARKAAYSLQQLPCAAPVLDRILLRKTISRAGRPVELVVIAEAWDGRAIREATARFLRLAAGLDPESVAAPRPSGPAVIRAGGDAAVIAYVGHNGLMDFAAPCRPEPNPDAFARSSIVLSCASNPYFLELLRTGGSHPLLLTTGLMAPEAYTLEAALRTFAAGAAAPEVKKAAAAAYAAFQHCSSKAAARLFVAQP